jgi:unsaturated rhamnogalacturonyl hydrolase
MQTLRTGRTNRKRVLGAQACLFIMILAPAVTAQNPPVPHSATAAQPAPGWDGEGDSPDDPGPLARDLSSALTVGDIDKVMRKVADWQLQRSQPYFSQDWTFGALYQGFMASSRVLKDARYADAMLAAGKKFLWQPGPRLIDPNYVGHGQPRGYTYDANNQAVTETYIELYQQHHDAAMIEPTRQRFAELMKEKDNPAAPLWWWCDALFMASPSWARLFDATGERAYLDYMDRQWWATSDFLYDPHEHLYFRDSNFFVKREANGQKLFWSRGNGWVMGGLARVLQDMPADYPSRPKYVAQYQQMAARLAALQGKDGLWRPGLLDPDAYGGPEMSGSAFFIYSLTWGVNNGVLEQKTYLPVIRKGWAGMVSHVYADGRVGSIQPIASGPGNYKPSSSYVYGVGAFLLAASELHQLALHLNEGEP